MNEPPSLMTDGAIWCSSGAATVLLVVRDGLVIDAPPYARRWALGREGQALWRRLAQRRFRLEWIPDHEPQERQRRCNPM